MNVLEIHNLLEKNNIPEGDRLDFMAILDPVVWSESTLSDPKYPNKPLRLREYQYDPLSYQPEIVVSGNREILVKRIKVFRMGRRLGKCLEANTRIPQKDGSIKTVKELFDKQNGSCISINDDYKFETTSDIDIFENGIKDIYRLKTRSGREIDVTDNHPFLMLDGWRELKDIKIGEQIIVPSKIDVEGNDVIDDRLVKLLGYLIGDGGLTKKTIAFTNSNLDIQKDFTDSCSYFKNVSTNFKKDKSTYTTLISGKMGKKNPIRKYLSDIGYKYENSHSKFVPDTIFRLKNKQVALFLSRLFACDGWASCSNTNNRGNYGIGYCSVSKDLIHGISHLLLRFGIKSFIRHRTTTCNGKVFWSYSLEIRSRDDILNFLENIMIYSKEKQCLKLKDVISKRSNINNGYFYQVPKNACKMYRIGDKNCGIRTKYNTSKKKLLRWAEKNNSKKLIDICKSDTFFDEVVSIEFLKNEMTYDLTVRPCHNFIANDIIVHNTVLLAIEAIWKACTNTNHKIVYIAPYESQCELIYNMIEALLAGSIMKPVRAVRKPYTVEFANGSIIKCYTANVRAARKGSTIRGAEADHIIIDEMDFGMDEVVNEILMPIYIGNSQCTITAASTPTGRRGLFWTWCFPFGSKVNTISGYKNIEDIKIGDYVFSKDGKLDKVTNLFKQPYEGDLINIKTQIGSLSCTPNHEILTLDKGFIPISEITTNDYVSVPIENYENVNLNIDEAQLYTDKELMRIACMNEYNKTGKVKETSDIFFKGKHGRKNISKYKKDIEKYNSLWMFDNRKRNKIIKLQNFAEKFNKKEINIENLCSLLGYYLAEGSIVKTKHGQISYDIGVQFSFHEKEKDYINEVKDYINELFPDVTCAEYSNREDHCHILVFYSAWVSTLFRILCGEYSDKKVIHPSIMGLNENLNLLYTFVNGDGHLLENGKNSFVTTSENLFKQLISIALKNNIYYSIYTRKLENRKKTYSAYGLKDTETIKIIDNKIYYKIISIGKENYNDLVFNFETERTHTYNVSNICVHNCTKAEELGMKEFYAPSYVSPEWTPESEKLARSTMTKDQYTHEVEADFGEAMEGVYRHGDLDEVLKPYKYETLKYNPKNKYVMGVDWNEQYGVRIIINEVMPNGSVRLFLHEKIEKQDFIQTVAVAKIIDIHMNQIRCDYIYVDKGYGACVDPNTLIYTDLGIKKIIDIDIGDKVMTFDGSYHDVLDKVIRKDDKLSYNLVPSKCLPTIISDCHPFLVYKSKDRFNDFNINEKELKWVKCPEIDIKKDFIAIAKTKDLDNNDSCMVDLYNLLKDKCDIKYDDRYVWLESSYLVKNRKNLSIRELSDICYTSSSIISRIKRKLKNKEVMTNIEKDIYTEYTTLFDYNECELLKIPRFIDILSEDFQRIYGWYLSEGNCNTNSIEFSQSIDKYHIEINELKQSLENIFPMSYIAEYIKHNSNKKDIRQIVAHGKIISLLFETISGKYSQNKFIYKDFMRNPKKLGVFIKCLIYGDGSCYGNGSGYEISLTSKSVIFQLRQILIDNGILPSMYYTPKREDIHQDQYKLMIGGEYNILSKFNKLTGLYVNNIVRVNRKKYIETDNYFLVPIRKLEKIGNVKGLVDIQVEGTESFCGNGIVLHNTQIELLKQYGNTNPKSKLEDILVPVDYNSTLEVRDPITGEKVPKPTKPYLISNSVLYVESHKCVIPEDEDYDYGLIGEMRNFRVRKISSTGAPVYEGKLRGEDNDHSLNAYVMSLAGVSLEYTSLGEYETTDKISQVSDFLVPDSNRSIENTLQSLRLNKLLGGSGITVGKHTQLIPGSKPMDPDYIKKMEGKSIARVNIKRGGRRQIKRTSF